MWCPEATEKDITRLEDIVVTQRINGMTMNDNYKGQAGNAEKTRLRLKE